MEFIKLSADISEEISRMSALASSIVKEYYDPLLGAEQNDYMIEKFQSVKGITEQLNHGYRYFFVRESAEDVGFIAIYPREKEMYLSKLYLKKSSRKKGYSHQMLDFVINEAKREKLHAVELNVNKYNNSVKVYEKLGFTRIRSEKNDIGNGYFMDDFVYRIEF